MEHTGKAISASPCKSVFRSGESTITKEQFTQIWIAMINRIEKGKNVSVVRRE